MAIRVKSGQHWLMAVDREKPDDQSWAWTTHEPWAHSFESDADATAVAEQYAKAGALAAPLLGYKIEHVNESTQAA